MTNFRSKNVEFLTFDLSWERSHGYSQAIRVGSEVRIAGQMPHDTQGNLLCDQNLRAQVAAVFANLDRVLRVFGLKRSQVIENVIYLVDLSSNAEVVSEEHLRFFGSHKPVSSMIGVSELAVPGQLIEISALARTDFVG